MDNGKNTSIPPAGLNSILAAFMIIIIILRYFTSEVPLFFIGIFFPVIPLIILSVFIGTIVFIIKNIRRLKILAFIPFFIVSTGILIIVLVPFSQIKLTLNFYYNLNDREKIVELIKNSRLEVNDNGYVVLPKQNENASLDGGVRIENDGGILKIFFYITHFDDWFTENTSGYVYVTNDIELNGYYFNGEIIKCVKITDNWYYCALRE